MYGRFTQTMAWRQLVELYRIHYLTSQFLWKPWWNRAEPEAPPIETCTIITTTASTDVAALHDLMPVQLAPNGHLVPSGRTAALLEQLLQPAPASTLARSRSIRVLVPCTLNART